jgi:prepilin-type N-terminal cleavage/methylation domain-containing protein
MMVRRRQDDGFTLVELLVSLALLSLMTIYALNAFSSLRDINRVVDRIGTQMEVEAVARHFRETLADVRPVFVMDENNAPKFLFKGAIDALEFVSASDGDRETGGLYLVRYSVNADGTLLAERRLLRDRQETEADNVVLLRDVDGISFSYLAPGASDGVDTWERKDTLPSAIAVTVTFSTKAPRIWPPTLIALRAAR